MGPPDHQSQAPTWHGLTKVYSFDWLSVTKDTTEADRLDFITRQEEPHHRHRSTAIADLTLKQLVGRVGLESTTDGS